MKEYEFIKNKSQPQKVSALVVYLRLKNQRPGN